MVQLLVKIGFFLGLIAIATMILGYFFIKLKVDDYQQEQINNATGIVVHAMESTQNSAKTIEFMIEEKLYSSSKGIMSELRGKQIEDISMDELREVASRWDVQEISLWERSGDDIIVSQSSDESQVGLSSKDWGYWFTAFDQLMSNEEVTVDQGFAKDSYWAGPISQAELFYNIYYKFAYYYDGTTSFMINPFIEDKEIYKLTFETGPTQMIEKIIDENVDIEEIAVINIPAWLKGEENVVIEPEIDLPVLYGTHELETEEDKEILQNVQNQKVSQITAFEKDGVSYKKIYKALPNDRVMAITIDLSRQKQMEKQLLLLFLGSLLVSSLALFAIIRFIAKRQLRPLQNIVQHIQGMAEGDLTKTLIINDKNELGWLAEHINEMTQRFNQLIAGVKEESHSLVIASSLLSQQVHTSVKTMGETSTTMTTESKDMLLEIGMYLEKLQRLFNTLTNDRQLESIDFELMDENLQLQLKSSLKEILEKLGHLEQMTNTHSSQMTEMTLMFYDTLQELNEALHRMDHLSIGLDQKIKFFKVD